MYFAAGEAVLVALNAKTGQEVWTSKVAENDSAYYISLAPLVADVLEKGIATISDGATVVFSDGSVINSANRLGEFSVAPSQNSFINSGSAIGASAMARFSVSLSGVTSS